LTLAHSHRENQTLQQTFRAGFEYQANDKMLLNVAVNGYSRHWTLNAYSDESRVNASQQQTGNKMRVTEENNWENFSTSVAATRNMKVGQMLSFTLDHLYFSNSNPSTYEIVSSQPTTESDTSYVALTKKTPIHFLVFRADYNGKIDSSFLWEAGIKSVWSTLGNVVSAKRRDLEDWNNDPLFSSSSDLRESIWAGYASASWTLRPSLKFKGGLRYEYTSTNINTASEDVAINRRYGYLFPNLSVQKDLGSERDVQFSYARRINRPGYNDIAPYVFFWGPRTFSAGNTGLYPSIADVLAAAFHRKHWTFTINLSRSKNEITSLQPGYDPQGNLIYRSENLKYLKTLSITNHYNLYITSSVDIQATFTLQYQTAKPANSLPELQRFGWNTGLNARVKLPAKFSAEVSATYQSRTISGISEYLPSGSLNAGINKDFGRHGIIQLAMDDILYTTNWRLKTEVPDAGLSTYFQYDWHNQFVRLSYTRRIGKSLSLPRQKSSGSEEERRRVN
jgi:hypothetical protein